MDLLFGTFMERNSHGVTFTELFLPRGTVALGSANDLRNMYPSFAGTAERARSTLHRVSLAKKPVERQETTESGELPTKPPEMPGSKLFELTPASPIRELTT